MPGPTIARHLIPHSYENFYAMAHAYSEDLIVVASGAKMRFQMAAKLVDVLPDDVFSSMAGTAQLKDAVGQLVTQTAQLQEAIQEYFWPQATAQGTSLSEGHNRERWAPYDGAAWDRLFAGLGAELAPQLTRLKQLVQVLDTSVVCLRGQAEKLLTGRVTYIHSLRGELGDMIDRLETLLDAEQLETLYAGRSRKE